MIDGAHVILYSTDAEADRVFIRDVLGFRWIDSGGGWLIFKLPPPEIAVHPTDGPEKHEFYLMCDDIEKMLTDLTARGVTITHPVSDEGWGCSPRSSYRAALICQSTNHFTLPHTTWKADVQKCEHRASETLLVSVACLRNKYDDHYWVLV
jgi:hypothetical protein